MTRPWPRIPPGSYRFPWPLFGQALRIESGPRGVIRLSWGEPVPTALPGPWALRFRSYLDGRTDALRLCPVDLSPLPPFHRRVLETLRRLPPGACTTYGELARSASRPGASRAVGGAMRANPVPIVIPCHRVLAAGGRLGGYAAGTAMKRILLEHEGIRLDPPPHPVTIPHA